MYLFIQVSKRFVSEEGAKKSYKQVSFTLILIVYLDVKLTWKYIYVAGMSLSDICTIFIHSFMFRDCFITGSLICLDFGK